MTPDELDLARAKDLYISDQSGTQSEAEKWWDKMPARFRDKYVAMARSSRLGDEARGLRVVPVYPTDAMADGFFAGQDKANEWDELPVWEGDFGNFAYSWSMALSASPFAPEKKR